MSGIDIFVDKITKSIEEAGTGKSLGTDVRRIAAVDLKGMLKKNGWKFNWRTEFAASERELYKLVIKGDEVIQGLISLQRAENYIEMHLIEVAPHNFGKGKKYAGVAGNLVAFACKLSFEEGFDGVVGFTAKTNLIQHYRESLGAEVIYRNRMCIWKKSAEKIVSSYYRGCFG